MVDVLNTCLGSELKAILRDRFGPAIKSQRLTHQNRQIQDHETLQFNQIYQESVVRLHYTLKGGSKTTSYAAQQTSMPLTDSDDNGDSTMRMLNKARLYLHIGTLVQHSQKTAVTLEYHH